MSGAVVSPSRALDADTVPILVAPMWDAIAVPRRPARTHGRHRRPSRCRRATCGVLVGLALWATRRTPRPLDTRPGARP